MGPVVCLPLVLSPASSLPATHREVRHSVVVRLEHSGVLEDVIPKRVEPIQRDQEISAADPLLERKQGRHKQVFLPCSPGKSCPLVLGKWGWPWGTGTGWPRQILRTDLELGDLGQSWGCWLCNLLTRPNALVPLSLCAKCSQVSSLGGVRRRSVVMLATGHGA